MTTKQKNKSIKKRRSAIEALEKIDGPLTLGRALRSERFCDEMTLKEFSELLGISATHLSDIEKGRRFVSSVKAAEFAELLGDSVPLFIQLTLEDTLRRSGLKFKVRVEAA